MNNPFTKGAPDSQGASQGTQARPRPPRPQPQGTPQAPQGTQARPRPPRPQARPQARPQVKPQTQGAAQDTDPQQEELLNTLANKKEARTAKKVKKKSFIHYFNFRYLKKEIIGYGYEFSFKSYMKYIGLVFLGVVAISFGFKLSLMSSFLLFVALMIALPKLVLNSFRTLYEQDRFACITDYMEQLIYSFKRKPKILMALTDVNQLNNNQLKPYLEKALETIRTQNSYRKAFDVIEEEYGCERLYDLHDFLINIEQRGGDFNNSLNIMLEDLQQWISRTYLLQKERKSLQAKTLLTLAIVGGVCVAAFRMLPTSIYDISRDQTFQWVTLGFIILLLVLFVVMQTMLVCSWLVAESTTKDEQILKDYETALHYDPKKGTKKAIISMLLFAGMGALSYLVMHNAKGGILCAVVGLYFLGQPKRHVKHARKRTINEIEKAYPRWLRGLVLLLQTENVYVAMSISYDDCPTVLKKDLRKLLDELRENPLELEPYTHFLEDFDLIEVRSTIQMLYSISEFGTADSEQQLNILIDRNTAMLDKAERLESEAQLSGYSVIALMPMVIGSAKLICDLFLFVLAFLNNVNL